MLCPSRRPYLGEQCSTRLNFRNRVQPQMLLLQYHLWLYSVSEIQSLGEWVSLPSLFSFTSLFKAFGGGSHLVKYFAPPEANHFLKQLTSYRKTKISAGSKQEVFNHVKQRIKLFENE